MGEDELKKLLDLAKQAGIELPEAKETGKVYKVEVSLTLSEKEYTELNGKLGEKSINDFVYDALFKSNPPKTGTNRGTRTRTVSRYKYSDLTPEQVEALYKEKLMPESAYNTKKQGGNPIGALSAKAQDFLDTLKAKK